MLATNENMPYILGMLEAYDEPIGIDTETTGLDVRNGVDFLQGISTDIPALGSYIPFRHKSQNVSKEWFSPLFEVLRNKALIWHNRKFDFHSIRTTGVDPRILLGPQYDVMMIAHMVDEELPSKELDWLAKVFLKEQKSDYMAELARIYGWANIPPDVMEEYAIQDARLARLLKDKLWPKLVAQGMEGVYWNKEAPFTTTLYSMEQRGVGVNKPLSAEMAERGRGRMATIQREFKFNPASPVDLGNYLLEELHLPVLGRTPKGAPSFRKTVMEEYDLILQASSNPAAQLIAEYRGWQKAVTSLYEPLLLKVGPDGRIRTNYKQHGTVTRRISATDPNLQQIPRGSSKPWNGRAKSCFTSGREGFILYGWDYRQIELRLATCYGWDEVLVAEFEREGADPFRVYCEILFGDFTLDGRQDTKTFFYANIYGAGLVKIDATLGWNDLARTQPVFNRFRASIPGIVEISRRVNEKMSRQGYVTYWDGSRRHIRNRSDQHKAWNSVLQGGASQIVKEASNRCEQFSDNDCQLALNVHDELAFLIREEALPDYEPKIKAAMTEFKNPDGSNLFPIKFELEGKQWK